MAAALVAALIAPASVSAVTVKQVALTFDDGDSELHIRQAVAVAVTTQTPITFFPTGRSLRRFPNLWKAIGDAGIPIANHTVTHPSLTKLFATKGAAGVKAELQAFINLARSLKIPVVPYWRPPRGAWNNGVRSAAQSMGLTLSMWTTSFSDTAPMCKNRTIVSYTKATSGTSSKVVVLGHVNPYTAQTVKLLSAVIANYGERGYTFVTIPTMVKGTPSNIDWTKAALAVSAPALRPTGPRVPTNPPVPIDHTNSRYTFAQANGITCR
jgi:peptidoglycan/xylan/chitin deacetylase (PgdA/CDA1 family)